MVIGNIMCLLRYDPDEVYRWFMELFIDAYDWVMVPNIYGMSLHSDGGLDDHKTLHKWKQLHSKNEQL